jgi:hypothetical protein
VAQPELRTALAILLGTTADALAGSQFLVDPNGWLRAQSRAGQPGGWPNAQRLALRARALSEHPLPGDAGGSQPHHH